VKPTERFAILSKKTWFARPAVPVATPQRLDVRLDEQLAQQTG
jgi:hypothetical protein